MFFKWIYQPSPEINTYWEHYLEAHSENAQIIREFKAGFQKHFRYKSQQLSIEEKKELALEILRSLDIQHKKSKHSKTIQLFVRYAAVAVICLLIGGGVSYFLFTYRPMNNLANFPPPGNFNIQEPTLILDDNQEISLNKGNSELEYSEKGEISVNKERVLEPEENSPGQMNTLVIPYGNSSTIILSDGTKVWLNAGSRLIYPSRFTDKSREVFLVGEAFFEVSKNEEKPFFVNTPDIKIKVLGTQFNVSAYPDDNIIQTVLTEGIVELSNLNPSFFDRSIEMKPGQMASFNKTNKEIKTYEVDASYYTSWKQGYLSFISTDLSRVVKKLERFYNIRIRYDDAMDGAMKISGKLDISKDKDVVFEYMNTLTGLDFNKLNDRIYVIK